MSKVLEFNREKERVDSEKLRSRYKRDFEEFVLKREKEREEKLYYFDTRKEM